MAETNIMKQVLTLVLALVVLGLMSISCESESHKESDRQQDLKTVCQKEAQLLDQMLGSDETILIDVYNTVDTNRLSSGDVVWVHVTPTNRYALFNANNNITEEFVNDIKVGHLLKRAIIK